MDYKQAIKDFMAKHQNQIQNGNPRMSPTLPGLQNMANSAVEPKGSTDTPKGYTHGGMVGGDDFLKSLQTGSSGMTDAPPVDEAPTFNPGSGMPPASTPPSLPTPQPQGSPISDYLAGQKAQLGKYGPDQQMAVSNSLLGRQNGLGGTIGTGLTTFADALMQGVARAGNPGFTSNLQNRQDKQAQMQLEALKGAREANRQDVGDNQKLDAMDPNSQLSASKREQNGPILAAMGFNPGTVAKMSAAEMDTTMQILKDFRGKDMEVAVAKMKAAIEAKQLQETARHNQAGESLEGTKTKELMRHNEADEANKGEEMQTGALEKAAAIPLTSRLAAKFGMNPAQAALEQKAGLGDTSHGIPDLGDTFNGHKVVSVKRLD